MASSCRERETRVGAPMQAGAAAATRGRRQRHGPGWGRASRRPARWGRPSLATRHLQPGAAWSVT